MKKTVFGIVNNNDQAQRIVDHLHNAGFNYEAISVLFADKGQIKNFGPGFKGTTTPTGTTHTDKTPKKGTLVHEKETKGPEGGATGATAGGIIGGTIGLLAGLGAISIPGLGAFIAAGPIMAALSGSAIGGSVGLLTGYLVGLGIPEYVVKGYESSLKAGNVLISVSTDTSEQVDKATNILKHEGAKDIASTLEKTKSR